MRLTALGGAGTVGASATLIENAGRKILIDAGIRPGATGEAAFPDLTRIEREGVDGWILTNARSSHWGALPRILQNRRIPGLTTRLTRDLVIHQARRIVERRRARGAQEGDVPGLRIRDVDLLEEALDGADYLQPRRPFGPDLRITLYPAGTLPGAASVLIESTEGRLWFSGDFCLRDLALVPGALFPLGRTDFAVVESSYGELPPSSRPDEERALLEAAGAALRRGGKVLFPVAPVGRAHELLLLFKRALRRGLVSAPIYLDGLFAELSDLFSEHPIFLRSEVRRELRSEGLAEGVNLRRVKNEADRQAVLEGPPCIILAGGVRLSGGPSARYARALAGDPDSAIFLCPDPDDEHPGERLFLKARATPPQLFVEGKVLPVSARIETYSLRLHAETKDVLTAVGRLLPRRCVLLHGSRGARTALGSHLKRFTNTETILPAEGEEVELVSRRSRRTLFPPRRPRSIRPVEPALLRALAAQLSAGQRKVFSLDELILLYTGQESVTDENYRRAFARAIENAEGFPRFVPDERRPYLYRTLTDEETRWSQEELRSFVEAVFQGTADYYRVGFNPLECKLKLYFDFPELARERHRSRFEAIEKATGWTVELHDLPRIERFAEVAREIIPAELYLATRPGVDPREKEVTIAVRQEVSEETREQWNEGFRRRTGYRLGLQIAPEDASGDPPPSRWEINRAFARILERFEAEPDTPYRKSLKTDDHGEYIELAFLTPEIGRRYVHLLTELSAETGWRIDLSPAANLAGLQDAVRSLLPKGTALAREPSYFPRERVVRIQLTRPLPESEAADLQARFKNKTGLPLQINPSPGDPSAGPSG